MKKKILFSLFFFLCVFFFRHEITNFCVKRLISYYVTQQWSSALKYSHFEKNKKGWCLRDVQIQSKDKFNLEVQSLQITPYFDLSTFELFIHLDINTFKGELSDIVLIGLKKNPRIHVSTNIERGQLNLFSKTYFFTCKQEPFSKEKIINFIDQEKTYLKITKTPSLQVKCRFYDFELADLQIFQKLTSNQFFQEGTGKVSGTCSFSLDPNLSDFSYDLTGKQVDIAFPSPSFYVQAEEIKLKGRSPKALFNSSNWERLSFLQKIKGTLQVKNGSFGSSGDTYLQEVSANLSYSPKLGPKWEIKGVGTMDQKNFPLQIKGKGFSHSIFSSWLEGSIEFEKKVSEISLKLKEIENKILDIQCVCKDIDYLYISYIQKILSIFYQKIPSFFFKQGSMDGKCSGKWVVSNSIQSNIKQLSGWVDIKDGAFTYLKPEYTFENLQAKIEVAKGRIYPSNISFQSNEIRGSIYLQGTLDSPLIQVKGKGLFQPILNMYPSLKEKFAKNNSLLFQTSFTLKKQGLFGTFQFENSSQKVFDSFTFGFSLKNFFEKEQVNISHGWVKGKDIELNKFKGSLKGKANVFATLENKQIQILVSGQEIEGDIYGTNFKINKLGGEDQELFDAHLCAQIQYGLQDQKLSFEIPLRKEICHVTKYNLSFEEIDGKLFYTDRVLKIDVEKTKCNQVNFSGVVLFETDNNHLQILTKNADGTISSLNQILVKLSVSSSLLERLSGKFVSDHNGLYITAVMDDPNIASQFKMSAKIYDGEFYISPKQSLQKLQASVLINGFDDTIVLDEMRAKLFVQSKKNQQVCDVYVPYIEKKEDQYQFDVRISKSFWDITRLVGTSYKKNSFYTICLDNDQTHFLGEKLNIEELIIERSFDISSLKMSSQLDLSSLISQSSFFSELFFPEISSDFIKSYQSLKGRLNCIIQYGLNQESKVEISGKNLELNHKKIPQLLIEAVRKEKIWDISNILIGSMHAKCLVSYQNGQLAIKDLIANLSEIGSIKMHCKMRDDFQINGDIDFLNLNGDLLNQIFQKDFGFHGNIQGQGRFSVDLPYKNRKWEVESDLDIKASTLLSKEFALENIDPLQVYFSLQNGLVIKGLNLHLFRPSDRLTWINCKIGRLYYQAKEGAYQFSDLQLYLPKENIKELIEKQSWIQSIKGKDILDFNHDLEICANGSFDLERLKCLINIDEHHLHLNKQTYFLRDLHLVLEPYRLQGECKIKYFSQFIPLGFLVNIKEMIDGNIYFKEKKEPPLTIHWIYDQAIQIKSMEGNFHGLNASFHRQTCDFTDPFMGSLKVNLKQASDLVPPLLAEFFTELSMEEGYEFMGQLSLSPFSFNGIFSGRDCALAGYIFKTLLSSIHIKQDRIEIKDFKISDKSGIFKIDQVHIEKNPKDHWVFSIPNIHIKEFRPSFLQKKDQELNPIKPLVIRDLNIYNLHGDLEDKKSYLGTGDLTFINSFKREHTLLDLPADVLGRIFGLDMELLIPAKGSLEFDIHDQKFFIHSLKEVYSEGKRSKFFLVDEKTPHTLDFNGNLNVYIQMKHFVLFKFTEPFILSIEGPLKDPNVSLKTKKKFFSSKEKD